MLNPEDEDGSFGRNFGASLLQINALYQRRQIFNPYTANVENMVS